MILKGCFCEKGLTRNSNICSSSTAKNINLKHMCSTITQVVSSSECHVNLKVITTSTIARTITLDNLLNHLRCPERNSTSAPL